MASFYDDASLALIPSGVKAGKVYSAKPVPSYGAEKVTNGDFATDTDWSKGSTWAISGGTANCTGNSTNQDLTQSNLTIGKLYYISVDITSSTLSSQAFRVYAGGVYTDFTLSGSAQTITTNLVASSAVLDLRVTSANSSGSVSIDNVSVKEVLIADGDFTFTRASEATRLVDGVVTKVRTNSLTYSNDFSNAVWVKAGGATVASGQADKDGGTDAWLLEAPSAVTSSSISNILSSSDTQVFSVYAKAGTTDWIRLNLSGLGNQYFDVANGVVGTSGSIDGSITDAGGGWYRCSVFGNGASTSNWVFLASADGNVTVADGDNAIIQNTQAEQGTVATDYIATTTVAVSEGPVANMPRLNSVAGGCPSLLLEPQRTNSLTQSEAFSQWTLEGSASLTSNAIASPDGYVNAAKLIAGASSARQSTKLADTSTGALAYSVYAKKGEYSVIQLTDAESGTMYANFDLDAGVIGGYAATTPLIESAGNGWYRCSMTYTAGATVNAMRVSIAESPTQARLVTFAGNGTDGVYLYGAQLEAGSYATSYIPTYGTAATRIGEVCNGAGTSATFNSVEGVLFADMSALANDGTYRLISLVDASDAGQTFLDIGYRDTDNTVRARMEVSGVLSAGLQYTISDTTTASKIAFKYKANDFALWINGIEVDTDSSGGVFAAGILDELTFSRSGVDFYGNTDQVLTFNTALTDLELETLTSYTSWTAMVNALNLNIINNV